MFVSLAEPSNSMIAQMHGKKKEKVEKEMPSPGLRPAAALRTDRR